MLASARTAQYHNRVPYTIFLGRHACSRGTSDQARLGWHQWGQRRRNRSSRLEGPCTPTLYLPQQLLTTSGPMYVPHSILPMYITRSAAWRECLVSAFANIYVCGFAPYRLDDVRWHHIPVKVILDVNVLCLITVHWVCDNIPMVDLKLPCRACDCYTLYFENLTS